MRSGLQQALVNKIATCPSMWVSPFSDFFTRTDNYGESIYLSHRIHEKYVAPNSVPI